MIQCWLLENLSNKCSWITNGYFFQKSFSFRAKKMNNLKSQGRRRTCKTPFSFSIDVTDNISLFQGWFDASLIRCVMISPGIHKIFITFALIKISTQKIHDPNIKSNCSSNLPGDTCDSRTSIPLRSLSSKTEHNNGLGYLSYRQNRVLAITLTLTCIFIFLLFFFPSCLLLCFFVHFNVVVCCCTTTVCRKR